MDAYWLDESVEGYWQSLGMGWIYMVSFLIQVMLALVGLRAAIRTLRRKDEARRSKTLMAVYVALLIPIGFTWFIARVVLDLIGVGTYRPPW